MPVADPPRPTRRAAPRAGRSSGSRERAGGRSPTSLPGEGRIRWDRVGRVALLALLVVVLALYVAPLRAWITQSQAAGEHRRDLQALEREHERLADRARELRSDSALEREARSLGMVRRGERAFVIQAPARSR